MPDTGVTKGLKGRYKRTPSFREVVEAVMLQPQLPPEEQAETETTTGLTGCNSPRPWDTGSRAGSQDISALGRLGKTFHPLAGETG